MATPSVHVLHVHAWGKLTGLVMVAEELGGLKQVHLPSGGSRQSLEGAQERVEGSECSEPAGSAFGGPRCGRGQKRGGATFFLKMRDCSAPV